MSEALHCDGPSCENWLSKLTGDTTKYIIIQKKYKYMHFCRWACLVEMAQEIDPIDGPSGMES